MYPLVLISIFNLGLSIHLFSIFYSIKNDLKKIENSKEPSGKIIQFLVQLKKETSGKRKNWNRFSEKLSFYDRRIRWLSNLASLATMTGLLGTVLGIYQAFLNMKANGSASAEVFASGISIALLTTIAGLCIAIPSVLCYYLLRNKLEDLESISYDYFYHFPSNS